MYTSFGKANDRFGFETKGSFKCAYKHDSVATAIGAALLLVWIIIIVINIIIFWSSIFSGKVEMYSIDNLFDLAQGEYSENATEETAEGQDSVEIPDKMRMFSSGFIGISVNSFATAFGIIVLILLLAGFIFMMIILRQGQNYEFKATEDRFIVTYPLKMGKTVLIKYEDVLGVKWTVRKLPLLPKCFDVEIKTRTGEYTFRVILTKLARVNGITETPFNIIRERAGLAENDIFYGV